MGYTCDTNGNPFAARWSARDPDFVQLLGFPGAGSSGAWSGAWKVNDNRIAAGLYGSNAIPENAFAVQFGPE